MSNILNYLETIANETQKNEAEVVIVRLEDDKIWYHDPDLKGDLMRNVSDFMKAWGKFSCKGGNRDSARLFLEQGCIYKSLFRFYFYTSG